jgi:hypothetical protein
MNATIEKQGNIEVLKIEIPISERRSTSGKTMVIASTNGNIPIGINYKDKPVILGLNAYYKP